MQHPIRFKIQTLSPHPYWTFWCNQYHKVSVRFRYYYASPCSIGKGKGGKLCIPMKSIMTRNICIVFIDFFMRFPPDFDARYTIMTEIRNPLKQSWAYIELLCRAQTYTIKTESKYPYKYMDILRWNLIFQRYQVHILWAKSKPLLVHSSQEKFFWQILHYPRGTSLLVYYYCTSE